MYKKVELNDDGFVGMEREVAQVWKDKDIIKKNFARNEGKRYFTFYDGPPTANGMPHAGHILTRVMKDIIPRYKVMQGYRVIRKAGWDTHGLPVELEIEKKLGISGKEQIEEYGVEKFVKECKESVFKYVHVWEEMTNKVGFWVDMEHPYITYENKYIESVWWALKELWEKGLLYEGHKVMPYCPRCGTALSSHEVAQGYKDVKFPVEDSKGLFDKKDTYVVIWTTTPWTLPGNMGITIGADYEYSMVELKENKEDAKLERLIIATELVEKVMKLAEIEDYKTVQTFKGSELEGVLCKHPFLDRMSRVVLGSETTVNVTLDEGTGAVHTAPAYGKEDYLQGLKDKLGMAVAVDDKGKQTAEAGEFAGQFYAKSNKTITAWLDENGYLLKAVKIEHSYPHCWRCKKPIIFRATPQWFASVDGFRDDVLKAIKTVTWHPDWGEDRMSEMIKGRNDWCISRQRTWGVPLPIFYCKDCGEPYVTEESIKKIQDVVRTEGTNAWWAKEAKDLVPEGAKCPKCGCTEFKKETDIMDVWFDSGSTHQSVLVERGLDYPADLYLEGNDQYRGWFQSSLLTSVAVNGIAPYKEVLCCGFVVDGQGRKMSKSLGNGVSPIDVSNKFGADILRLWALSSDYSMDVNLSDDILKGISDVYRKIRNTARYILGNTYDYDPEKPVAYEDLQEIDKWALTRLNKLIKDCTKDYDTYSFGNCYHDVNQFCVVDMSSFYLDIIKDRLYTEKADSVARRAAQTTMYYILDALVKILTPMISFTAEEIWSAMKHTEKENVESPMLADYPVSNDEWDNKEIAEKWEKIIKVKNIVAKDLELARAEKTIGNSLDAKVTIYAEGEEYKFLKENEELIKLVLIVSGLEIQENNRKQEEKLGIKVEHATGEKCERCWMYNDHIEDGLCPRCKEVLEK